MSNAFDAGEARIFRPRPLIAALVAAGVYVLLGLYVLMHGHLHEDAYILFIYSEELAETRRIAYFSGGPRAEGATDFLWMVTIAALNAFGLPSGVAALALNALGVALISGLVTSLAQGFGGQPVIAAIGASTVAVFGFVQSGYGGFSAPLYAALTLSIAILLLRSGNARLVLVPILSIVLALFRPDGVILGIGFTLIGLALTPTTLRARYLAAAGAAFLTGVVYFVWRWSYFDAFLPLPLIVKSEGDALLNGLKSNGRWLEDVAILIPAAVFAVALYFPSPKRAALAALPVVALLVFLSFGVQSQNVAFRFQAPVTVLLFACVVVGVAVMYQRLSVKVHRIAICVGLLGLVAATEVVDLGREVRYLTNDDYINFMPIHLAGRISGDADIALSEAGRLAYWIPGRFYDLVGLNTERTARHGADATYLEELSPDIIFVHTARTASFPCDQNYCPLDPEDFVAIVDGLPLPSSTNDRVRKAPLAAYDFLRRDPSSYVMLVVRYGRGHPHLYAIAREGMVSPSEVINAIETSFMSSGQLSYLEAVTRR